MAESRVNRPTRSCVQKIFDQVRTIFVYRTDLDIDRHTVSEALGKFVQCMFRVSIEYIKVSYPVPTEVWPSH